MSDASVAVDTAVQAIRKHTDLSPKVAVLLGSGLGGVTESLGEDISISYRDIPGFPIPSVSGHAGTMTFAGNSTEYSSGILCLQGRVHLYEGREQIEALKVMVRAIKALGVEILMLTNAAGSLRREVGPGELVMVTDHINLLGTNPLMGPNDDEFGPRFVGMDNAWDPEIRATLHEAALDAHVPLHEGVFAAWLGPTFETPAEIQMMARMGADTVGMSMVPECITARHCGLRVGGVSAITNLAAGLSPVPLSHDQTLEGAKLANAKMSRLITAFVKKITA